MDLVFTLSKNKIIILILCLFPVLGIGVDSQGFSAIGAAFIAYAMISIVLWMLGDLLEGFDHPEYFRSRLLFIVMCGLLHLVGLNYVIMEQRGREFIFIFNDHSEL